jgi:serine phosphatase RsbU (regulator of sigma subunit)
VYRERGDYAKALENYFKTLKINEELKDKAGIELNTGIIGSIYFKQDNYPKALEYFSKALKAARELGNKDHESSWLGSIGLVYDKKNDNQKALDHFQQALKLSEELENKNSVSLWLGNLGNVYRRMKDNTKALDCYFRALKTKEELGDKNSTALNLVNIGSLYALAKKNGPAREYLDKSLAISLQIRNKSLLKENYYWLARLDSATKNFSDAFKHHKLFILYRDSIDNEEIRKQSLQATMQYEYDKKQALADAAHKSAMDKQAAVSEEQSRRQNSIIAAVIIGLVLVIVFAGFMYNRFRITQKQKQIIELKEKETSVQKHIIEEKHKEITDSINYAERIQRSFLASKELLDAHLKEYFVYFQPRDVVSGDFYWAASRASATQNLFYLCTADSTGHGVPGAIMSLLNITSLERAIEYYSDPAEILNDTRKTIIERLKKDGSPEGGKDGMDCSLIVLDKNKKQLRYAAANNPVWIVREGNLLEFVPDKMPVGKHDKDQLPFTEHTVGLQSGDMIYTLTDGMPDQFGGPKAKKFMYKQLKELLIAIAHLPASEQKEKLEKILNDWKGDLEQVDDVCVIGVRV